jgi:hypothetical protein
MSDSQMDPLKSGSGAAKAAPHGGGSTGGIASVMAVNASISFGGDGTTATINVAQEQIDPSANNVQVFWNGPRVFSTANPSDPALDTVQVNYVDGSTNNSLKIVVSYPSGTPDTYVKNNITATINTTANVSLNRL